MAKLEQIKETVNNAEEFARKIWLAGLGAYGKSFDEVQGKYEKLNTESTKIFEDLISKGEKLESEAKSKFNEEKSNVEKKVSARVSEVRQKLGLDKDDTDQKIEDLSAKIDALTAAVAKLAEK